MIVSYNEAAAFIGDAPLASNAQFKALVDAVDLFIKGYCGRTFDFARFTEYRGTEGGALAGYSGATVSWVGSGLSYGFNSVLLIEDPVKTIVSVLFDPIGLFQSPSVQTLDVSKFYVRNRRELVYATGVFPPSQRGLQVVYDAGYYMADDPDNALTPRMPADLRKVANTLIAQEWDIGAKERFRNENIGAYSYRRFEDQLDPVQTGILDNTYRRW